MARYKSYNFRCTECEHISTLLATEEERDQGQPCEKCGELAKYTISFPAIRTQKTSVTGFVEGHAPDSRKAEFAELEKAEAAKIKMIENGEPGSEEYQELEQEYLERTSIKR